MWTNQTGGGLAAVKEMNSHRWIHLQPIGQNTTNRLRVLRNPNANCQKGT